MVPNTEFDFLPELRHRFGGGGRGHVLQDPAAGHLRETRALRTADRRCAEPSVKSPYVVRMEVTLQVPQNLRLVVLLWRLLVLAVFQDAMDFTEKGTLNKKKPKPKQRQLDKNVPPPAI